MLIISLNVGWLVGWFGKLPVGFVTTNTINSLVSNPAGNEQCRKNNKNKIYREKSIPMTALWLSSTLLTF